MSLARAVDQMIGAGMPPLPPGHPRAEGRIVRYGPKKRAWYVLREFTGKNGRAYVAGAFGLWGQIESQAIEPDWTQTDPAERARLDAERRKLEAQEREKRERLAAFAANRARSQYGSALDRAPCPYLDAKRVPAERPLRFVNDGTLVVPAYRYDENPPRLVTVQKIAPDGSKRFNKNAAKLGAACLLGQVKAGRPVAIAEGVATALSVRLALSREVPVFIAFDAGNLEPVARIVRAKYPDSPVLLCADDDWKTVCPRHQADGRTEPDISPDRPDWCRCNPGVTYADEAARACGPSLVTFPRFPDGQPRPDKATDWNDLHAIAGSDAVRDQLAAALATLAEGKGATSTAGSGGRKKKAPPPDPPDDGPERPVIRWKDGHLPRIVDEAEAALLASPLRIYRRGNALVRVVRTEQSSVRFYKRPQVGALGIRMVDGPWLVEALTRAARWEKWDLRLEDWRVTNCPKAVAETYLAREGEWKLPRLLGTISAPTLRPDGSILQDPGYDEPTGTLYDPCGTEYPRIPEEPGLADAEAALEILRKAFSTFPFAGEEDESVCLALAMTGLVRRSLVSAPLGAITAPTMASGKTLIADLISILATGVASPAMRYPDSDEEAGKAALAVLAEGDAVVLIDNIERPLQGDWLCSILTSEIYRDRLLGQSKTLTVPTATLFLATGNQLVIAGDLRTRALLCRIDPKTERPEQRQFRTDIRDWFTRRRPELVAAALTVMRAYVAAGRPSGLDKWGRFESWSDMVRAPLVWLGRKDPLSSIKALEDEDPERNNLLAVLYGWRKAIGTAEMTLSQIVRAATEAGNESFLEALRPVAGERNGTLSVHRLASYLRRRKDRLADGMRIVHGGRRDNTITWRLEMAAGGGGLGG